MKTLYDRLLEICRDHHVESPKNRDIQHIAKISSGRVTQIKQGGEAARLGAESLAHLVRLGYSPDWIQEGRGKKRASGVIQIAARSFDPDIAEVVRIMEQADEATRMQILGYVSGMADARKPAQRQKGAAK